MSGRAERGRAAVRAEVPDGFAHPQLPQPLFADPATPLPSGVQIIGRAFREDLCLAAAQEIEDRLGVLTPIDPRPEVPAAAR
ncbi:hypothetical protein ABZ958_05155 [Streptomyces sp. NPDC046237]|uniref:hypothetical protein n=1 Tax=Streptomyces sp. NPDC046237 TaxID=3154914 RepID=UPI0033FE4AA2